MKIVLLALASPLIIISTIGGVQYAIEQGVNPILANAVGWTVGFVSYPALVMFWFSRRNRKNATRKPGCF